MICYVGFEIWGRVLRFVLVIHRSENGRKIYLVVGWENEGKYEQYKDKLVHKSTRTRKCKCSFKLKGKFVKELDWRLFVISGIHNHKVSETLLGHAYDGHLSSEEKNYV